MHSRSTIMTRQVGVVGAVAILTALALQGCEMPGSVEGWKEQFSEVGSKALGQASHFANAAKAAGEHALKDASVHAAKLKEESAKLLAAGKLKAKDLQSKAQEAMATAKEHGAHALAEAKKKLAEAKKATGAKAKELQAKAEKAVAAAKEHGAKALVAAHKKLDEAKEHADLLVKKAKVKAAEFQDQAGKALEKAKEIAAKAKEALEAVKKGGLLEKANEHAQELLKHATEHADSLKDLGKTVIEKAKAAVKEASTPEAIEKAKKELAALRVKIEGPLTAAADTAKEAAAKAAAQAKEYHDALTEAKKTAADAKQTATEGGADERLFELPDHLKNDLPAANSAAYYAGLASISLVSFSFAMLAVRKFSMGRREQVSEEVSELLENGVE